MESLYICLPILIFENMSNENGLGKFIAILVPIYILISQIATFIFWIQYCKKDSILEIILIDPFISELKGLLWPFFV